MNQKPIVINTVVFLAQIQLFVTGAKLFYSSYIAKASQNYHAGIYDQTLLPDNWGLSSAEEAFGRIEKSSGLLQTNTLLHGDYFLPNIIFDNWKFSKFIDVDR